MVQVALLTIPFFVSFRLLKVYFNSHKAAILPVSNRLLFCTKDVSVKVGCRFDNRKTRVEQSVPVFLRTSQTSYRKLAVVC
jgi:hypothetical protein